MQGLPTRCNYLFRPRISIIQGCPICHKILWFEAILNIHLRHWMNKSEFKPSAFYDLTLLQQLKTSRALLQKKKKSQEPNLHLTSSTPSKKLLTVPREEFQAFQFETTTVVPRGRFN
eukprot:9678619-Ditylum_brightwellii.AAC.1